MVFSDMVAVLLESCTSSSMTPFCGAETSENIESARQDIDPADDSIQIAGNAREHVEIPDAFSMVRWLLVVPVSRFANFSFRCNGV